VVFYSVKGPRLSDALHDPDWSAAMASELANFEKFQVWKLVPRKPEHRPVRTNWILTEKINEDTGVSVKKGRLVMDGSRQKEGIDFDATFAATPQMGSFKVVMAIVVHRGMRVASGDAQSAHLQAPSDRVMHIFIPPGMKVDVDRNQYLLELQRTMYGQKQAPLQWEKHRNQILRDCGFVQCPQDACVFSRSFGKFRIIIHAHSDDLFFAWDDAIDAKFQEIRTDLESRLYLRYNPQPTVHLGIELRFDSSRSSVSMNQSNYTRRILDEFLEHPLRINRNPWPLHLDSEFDCPTDTVDNDFFANRDYPRLVGKLVFLLNTRPELSIYISKLTRFIKNPRPVHWEAAQYLLQHLNGCTDFGLHFTREHVTDPYTVINPTLNYSDADWGGDLATRRSTTGEAILLCGGVIIHQSKRQTTVADSTVVAETNALCTVVKDVLWLRDFLSWLGYPAESSSIVWCDNKGTVRNTEEGALRHKTKHMDLKYMFLRDLIKDGHISVKYLPTRLQLADLFTKPLKWIKFNQFRDSIGVRELNSPVVEFKGSVCVGIREQGSVVSGK
jgi:hypothetical protein